MINCRLHLNFISFFTIVLFLFHNLIQGSTLHFSVPSPLVSLICYSSSVSPCLFSRVFYNKLVVYFVEFSSVWVPMFCLDETEVAHYGEGYRRGRVLLSMLCQRRMMSIQLLLVMLTLTPWVRWSLPGFSIVKLLLFPL